MTMTWREEISREMAKHGDHWGNMVGKAVETEGNADAALDRNVDHAQEIEFTVWTKERVYWRVDCELAGGYCGSVARYPNGKVASA